MYINSQPGIASTVLQLVDFWEEKLEQPLQEIIKMLTHFSSFAHFISWS